MNDLLNRLWVERLKKRPEWRRELRQSAIVLLMLTVVVGTQVVLEAERYQSGEIPLAAKLEQPGGSLLDRPSITHTTRT